MSGEIGLTEVSATSQAVIASIVQDVLKQQAIMLPTVTDYSSYAQPGDKSVSIPRRTQFAAADKAENTALTNQVLTFATDTIDLNLHKAIYASMERIASLQANVNVQGEIITEMTKELALQVDKNLIAALKLVSTAAPDHSIGFNSGSAIAQTDLLEMRKLLNVAKVPMTDRYLLVGPAQEKNMLLISDFVQAQTYGNAGGLINGELGRIYGMTVVMHTEIGDTEVLAYHKSHVGFAMQMQPEYMTNVDLKNAAQEYLLHCVYGVKTLDLGKRGVLVTA